MLGCFLTAPVVWRTPQAFVPGGAHSRRRFLVEDRRCRGLAVAGARGAGGLGSGRRTHHGTLPRGQASLGDERLRLICHVFSSWRISETARSSKHRARNTSFVSPCPMPKGKRSTQEICKVEQRNMVFLHRQRCTDITRVIDPG